VARAGAVALVLAPGLAWADPVEEAKTLFAQGRALRSANRCAEAIPVFRRALEVYPAGLGSERNIAECEEELGHYAAARRVWTELQRAVAQNGEPRYAEWAHDAEQAQARLAGRVARLTITVGASSTEGSAGSPGQVTINGVPLPTSEWGTALEADPGHYVVRYEGGAPVELTLDLAGGETRQVTLRPGGRAAPAAALAAAPPLTHDPRQPLRIGGWVALGMGVASLIGAGISGLIEQDALNQAQRECPHNHCTSDQSALQTRGQTSEWVARVLLVGGGLGLVTSAVLFELGHGVSPKSEITVGPGGVGVTGRF
jgi:hypothetical protein